MALEPRELGLGYTSGEGCSWSSASATKGGDLVEQGRANPDYRLHLFLLL